MRIHPACLVLAVTLTVGLTACGGGGSEPMVAPSITNLTYSARWCPDVTWGGTYTPTAVYVGSHGGTCTVDGTFSYTDTNGGLASVTLALTDASGATVAKTTTAVPPGAPPTSGTLQGSVTFSTTVAGNYTIRVSVTDVAGLVSNELTGGFRIAPHPWVAMVVPIAPSYAWVAAASGGRLYLIEAATAPPGTVLVYDPAADSWTTGPALTNSHFKGAVAAAANGVVYVIGGVDYGTQTVLSTVDALDTATGMWSTKKPMPTPRFGAAATVVNNRICVVGGYNDASIWVVAPALNSMECYDPVADSWSSGPAMPTGRMRLGFDAIGSSAYAVGGGCCYLSSSSLASVERYDAAANAWTTIASMTRSRSSHAVVAAGGLLFAIGSDTSYWHYEWQFDTVEAYDPSLAAWKAKTPMPWGANGELRGAQIGGVIYVIRGGSVWQYTPANDIL